MEAENGRARREASRARTSVNSDVVRYSPAGRSKNDGAVRRSTRKGWAREFGPVAHQTPRMRSSSRVSARMASRAATCSGSFLSTLASNASSARRSSSRFSFRTDPPKRSGLRETPEAGRGAIFAGRGARGARSGARESGAFGASRRAARGIGARAGGRERRTRRGRRLVSQPARGVADTAPHTCERPRVQSSTDRGRASRGARFDLSRVVLLAPARTRPGAPGSCDRARSRTPVVATPPRARFRAPSSPTRAERPRGARVVGRSLHIEARPFVVRFVGRSVLQSAPLLGKRRRSGSWEPPPRSPTGASASSQ